MRLAIDFDGVLQENIYPSFGKILPGAKEALKKLKKAGHYITIYSSRTCEELRDNEFDMKKHKEDIENFLKNNDIPFDEIYDKRGKPPCTFYIDDRNIEFKNNWPEIIARLLNI